MTQHATLIRAATPAASVDVARRYAEFVASTEAVDSHGTIVRQNWNLDRYRKNPIVLWNHCTDDPIGTAEMRLEDDQLVAGITFAKGTEDAEEVWTLVQQGVLRAVSVGFRPSAFELVEMGDDFVVLYDAPELYELSVVSIPSNPEALARAYAHSASAEQEIRLAALARRDAPKENTMAEQIKPAPVAEVAAVAPAVSAPETVNKEAMDIVVKTLRDQITDRDSDIVKLKADNAKMLVDLADAKKVSVEAKVRGFVGSKLTEATLPKFLELAKKSEEAFDAAIEALPDLGIAPGTQVVTDAKTSSRGAGDEDAKVEWITKRAAEIRKERPELSKMAATSAANHEAEARGLLGDRHDSKRELPQRAVRVPKPREDRGRSDCGRQ